MKRSVILFGGPLAGEEFEVEDKVINTGELRFPATHEIDVTVLGDDPDTPNTITTTRYHRYQLKAQLHPRWHMVDKPMFMFEYVGEATTWGESQATREKHLDALDAIRNRQPTQTAKMLSDEDDKIL